jgi:uncharacterized protein (DUF58 family)
VSGRFDRHFPGFALRPTRAFWWFLLVVPVIGVAALNTGNNALYVLLSISLGAFVASGYLSRHTLRHLSATVRPPAEAFCGAPVRLEVTVANGSRWLPAFGVACRLVGLPGVAPVPTVPPGGRVTVPLVTAFRRRGRHRLPAPRLEVRLPLPFFVKATRLDQAGEALVFPRRVVAGAARWARLSRREEITLGGPVRRRGEVEQLREFRAGDDQRDIHWKQTARQQRPIVMERRERAAASRFLVLDRELPRRDDARLLERFEDLVSEVASAALAQLRRGQPVGLVLGGSVTRPGTGAGHARLLLERLALVEPVGPGEDPLPPAVGAGPAYRLVETR